MRIVMVNQAFYPDVVATAQHGHDLAAYLASKGHEVHAIASRSVYGEKGATLEKEAHIDGYTIHRVGWSLFGKGNIAARTLDFAIFYVLATVKVFTLARADVVICFTTPPFISLVGWLSRIFRKSKWVYWVMDLYPEAPIACGIMRKQGILAWLFEKVNRFCLCDADAVVVLGRCMQDRVLAKGVDREHVHHIGVWSDSDEIIPSSRYDNPYRKQWNLGSKFVVMYSGNFGLGHDVLTMCEAALFLQDRESIHFVFSGGGKKKQMVEDFVAQHNLRNVTLSPYQPREKLGDLLALADIHIVSLIEGLEGVIVPCKLFGIMAASRPAIFIGHPSSELSRVLEEHEAGVTVPMGNIDLLCEMILRLEDDEALRIMMGKRARKALETAYNKNKACERWHSLLQELMGVEVAAAQIET